MASISRKELLSRLQKKYRTLHICFEGLYVFALLKEQPIGYVPLAVYASDEMADELDLSDGSMVYDKNDEHYQRCMENPLFEELTGLKAFRTLYIRFRDQNVYCLLHCYNDKKKTLVMTPVLIFTDHSLREKICREYQTK